MTTTHGANGVARRTAKALARWEGEGGGLGASDGVRDPLDKNDLRILRRLGEALLAEWNNLPAEIQRNLFRRATTPVADSARLKPEIARFLHIHKDDTLGDPS